MNALFEHVNHTIFGAVRTREWGGGADGKKSRSFMYGSSEDFLSKGQKTLGEGGWITQLYFLFQEKKSPVKTVFNE